MLYWDVRVWRLRPDSSRKIIFKRKVEGYNSMMKQRKELKKKDAEKKMDIWFGDIENWEQIKNHPHLEMARYGENSELPLKNKFDNHLWPHILV